MNILLRRVTAAFPWVGKRSASEDDFFQFCASRNIEIIFTPDANTGIYAMFSGRHFIFINSRLTGRRLLHVALHELGHYLLHVPTQRQHAVNVFDYHAKEKHHCEAETVAALLLLPLQLIEELLINGVHIKEHETADLIGRRLDIYKMHGI